ncbi:helicase, putative [Pediculus humanus corporis]|uniref:Transcription termination factor 2 n=1 Tax=Pediculus humanus subsp. corporis TaxID=121224 RepID=E0W0N6_PEDHC|nr:helicase, putative [Pediculus humanus corporis]EEB19192.1 helicase, putative [Pediculus humanus corporis]
MVVYSDSDSDKDDYDGNITDDESKSDSSSISTDASISEESNTSGNSNNNSKSTLEYVLPNAEELKTKVLNEEKPKKVEELNLCKETLVEDSYNGQDILVSDSSISMDSKIILNSSDNESSNDLQKESAEENNSSLGRIVEESSDSDSSVKCIDLTNSVSVLEPENSQSSVQSLDDYKTLKRELEDKKTSYQNIMRAIKYCDPNKLKDGGKLLKEKLAQCKEEVDELKKKLSTYGDVSSNNNSLKKHSHEFDILSTTDQITNNLGKKGLETHRVQEALTVDALVTLCDSIKTCPTEDVQEKDPNGLRVELMPHQKHALAWLLWREKQTPSGGILADDMGLGKTLTMIALILRSDEYQKLKKENEVNGSFVVNDVKMYYGKTLVVCPSSLMGQWQGQIKQHCRSQKLSYLVHHGKPRELQAKRLAVYDVVITSYGVIAEENKIIKDNKKGALFRVVWKRIIIDEGHVIRNHKTKKAQALCELEAKHRWCLTGTPVHNKELDMYSLLKFLRCSPFDNINVWKRWVDNKSANGVKRLNTVVKSILLRRTKEDLKNIGELRELPVKNIIPIYIKLDEEEQKVYHTVLNFSKSLLADFIMQAQRKNGFVSDELKNQHHKLLSSANEIKTTEIFVLLLRLRQICCLPGLIHSMLEKDSCAEDGIDIEDDPILQDLTSQMKRMSVVSSGYGVKEVEKRQKILVKGNPVFEINRLSTKIKTVVKLVEEALEADDKIIIVSQWAGLLQKLKTHILSLKTGVVTLDGSVPVKFRPKIIDDFNNPKTGIKVMLLSLTAGGVGLNLVGGNRLVIIEPHWNPQLESQACDRIYRVGQKKPVYVYKIICQETIEERIELLQKKKLEVAETVLKGELTLNKNKMTLADLKILFDVHEK